MPDRESEHRMKQEHMTEILMLVKRIGTLFNEVDDLSRQLGEAIDRRDEVAIKMVLAMRSEPIEKLMIADRSLRELLMSLESGEESARIRAILNGDEDKATTEQEKLLAEQAAMNIRAHQKLLELDGVLNRRIAKDKSIYHT